MIGRAAIYWGLNVVCCALVGIVMGNGIDRVVDRISYDYVYPPGGAFRRELLHAMLVGTLLGVADYWMNADGLPAKLWVRTWRGMALLPCVVLGTAILAALIARIGWNDAAVTGAPSARQWLCNGLVESTPIGWTMAWGCIVLDRLRACRRLNVEPSPTDTDDNST